jgi:TorA maturation chaperone TorD
LYVFPQREWIKSLIDGDIFSEAPFANEQPDVRTAIQTLRAWSEKNRDLSDAAFEDICADYTRLFIGPGIVIAPPWESVHFSEERLTFQEQTLKVREWYRRFGLQAEKIYQEPDDHIGLQLEFLTHLARRALAAVEQNDHSELKNLVDAQRNFLREHLDRWAPAWCELVEQNARTDFYRGMARLCKGVLLELTSVLEMKIP